MIAPFVDHDIYLTVGLLHDVWHKCKTFLSHVFSLQQGQGFFSASGQIVVLKVIMYLSWLDYLNVIKLGDKRWFTFQCFCQFIPSGEQKTQFDFLIAIAVQVYHLLPDKQWLKYLTSILLFANLQQIYLCD